MDDEEQDDSSYIALVMLTIVINVLLIFSISTSHSGSKTSNAVTALLFNPIANVIFLISAVVIMVRNPLDYYSKWKTAGFVLPILCFIIIIVYNNTFGKGSGC
ncbi:hypothetical protein [Flavobacterium sp.]|uniref:hypothetical protein n=1 Tax=Flavobacterium sp. TaxID=239 RepID=UPI00286DDFD0|nr:hypothetical protein [Flavobacterium sp.]